jgi:hypothetical protein
MPFDHFTVHDVADFPIVRSRCEAVVPGYAAPWASEMDALLAHGRPFVMIFPTGRLEEGHEDRKHRGLWLKKNKVALGSLCLSLVTVEPDALTRVAIRAQLAMAIKAFGVPMEVVATIEEAHDHAARMLAEHTAAACPGR